MPVYKSGKTYYFKCCINGRQFLRRGFATKREAQEAEIDFIYENKGNAKNKPKMILTWPKLVEYYLKHLKAQVKITYHYSTSNLLNSILDLFPTIDVNKLLYVDFERARARIDKLEVSIKRKNRLLKLIKAVFEYGRIYHNIKNVEVEKMQLFKDYTVKRKTSLKKEVVTFSEFKSLYDVCDPYYKLLFLTLYTFGLRIGEAMGLKVDSFDLDNQIMQIYQSISWKSGTGSYVVITPKTASSNRFYYLPELYIKAIGTHIKNNHLKDNDFIFFSSKSHTRPLSEHALRNKYKRYAELANFPHGTKFHIFRHTNASELLAHGVSLEDIKDYEGHSSVEVTERFYLHQTEESKKRTMEVLNIILSNL